MADLTVTSAVPVAGALNAFANGTAGEAISVGDWVYRDAADSYKFKLADATSSAKAAAVGVALSTSSSGQPLRIQTAGRVTLGATLEVGMVYTLSGASGTDNMAPVTDVDSGEYVTILGVASTSAILDIGINATGILSAVNI